MREEGLELTGTHVKYLLAIYETGRSGRGVRSAEVARRLGVSRPSVTRMLAVLTQKGLTTKARYGKIALTEAGEGVACRCEEGVGRLARLLAQGGWALTPVELRDAAVALAGLLPAHCLLDAPQEPAGR